MEMLTEFSLILANNQRTRAMLAQCPLPKPSAYSSSELGFGQLQCEHPRLYSMQGLKLVWRLQNVLRNPLVRRSP